MAAAVGQLVSEAANLSTVSKSALSGIRDSYETRGFLGFGTGVWSIPQNLPLS